MSLFIRRDGVLKEYELAIRSGGVLSRYKVLSSRTGDVAVPPEAPPHTPTPPADTTVVNPFLGRTLFRDPHSQPAVWVRNNPGHPYRPLIEQKIVAYPFSQWGYATVLWNNQTSQQWADNLRTQHGDNIGILVLYNITLRDLNNHSRGGASSADVYRQWIDGIVAGLRGRPTVLLLEPDAVPDMTRMTSAQRLERASLLRYAMQRLGEAGHYVYLDCGHPRWINATTLIPLLHEVNAELAHGLSYNVSNFYTTSEVQTHGERVCDLFTRKPLRYIIDTSRNGNGPAADAGDPINPLGRALGRPPGELPPGRCDAYVWIKTPGESDGANGRVEFDGSVAPPPGEFWPAYAYGLAQRAPF